MIPHFARDYKLCVFKMGNSIQNIICFIPECIMGINILQIWWILEVLSTLFLLWGFQLFFHFGDEFSLMIYQLCHIPLFHDGTRSQVNHENAVGFEGIAENIVIEAIDNFKLVHVPQGWAILAFDPQRLLVLPSDGVKGLENWCAIGCPQDFWSIVCSLGCKTPSLLYFVKFWHFPSLF